MTDVSRHPMADRKFESGSRREQDFEMRSCLRKIRYKFEPTCTLNQYAYPCRFCSGWHKATKKS